MGKLTIFIAEGDWQNRSAAEAASGSSIPTKSLPSLTQRARFGS
ncbi:hypothetical protein SNE35_09740 [Paucibacter sp. R3-3]|uniref:Uncharacterized protein n=1 Tax=Roseateles agri TaxID=3098619 RepID=A0ABU5DEU1_9BURK|nr:hypothetical protein [Paucibacter sp. R3-3]MDY0744790.1 hypothetical protein [Paucibacter sp. R3-3]